MSSPDGWNRTTDVYPKGPDLQSGAIAAMRHLDCREQWPRPTTGFRRSNILAGCAYPGRFTLYKAERKRIELLSFLQPAVFKTVSSSMPGSLQMSLAGFEPARYYYFASDFKSDVYCQFHHRD